MNRKSIWIICHYASPTKYGYGGRPFFLAEEFMKMGYDVTVFASTSNYQLITKPAVKRIFASEEINGVKVVWVRGMNYSDTRGLKRVISWFQFSFLLLFFRYKKLSKPDVIIVSSLSIVPVINGWLLKKRYPGAQYIFEIRDIWPQTLIDIGGYSKFNPLVMLIGCLEKFGYNQADHIVATMPRADLHIKKIIRKSFNYTCIPQGIDLDTLSKNADLSSEEIDKYFPSSGFVVGYAGAIGMSNSLGTLINAARIIDKWSFKDIYFVLLGDGNDKEHLRKMASGLTNISFMPRIPKNRVQSFLKKCSILHDSVKPVPLYDYGLSRNKWMDYMISGKPMIVSYSGFVSLINEANCGTVVPAGDPEKLAEAIIEYYKMDRVLLEQIGQRGRDYVFRNRTFDVLAKQYQKIFES